MIANFLTKVKSIFASLLGNISWNSPPWFAKIKQKAKTNPARFFASLFYILILTGGVVYGCYWYSQMPKPVTITAKITPPKITPITEEDALVPDNLVMDFGIQNGEFTLKSVAPLNNVDRKVTEGIRMTPDFPGSWAWQGDSKLVFTPEKDWPAGQEYRIQFDKKAFADNAKMESLKYTFSTEPFKVAIQSFNFYQDPVTQDVRQAVATLEFNFPVDTNTVSRQVAMKWQAFKDQSSGEPLKISIAYDKFKRKAYIHSDTLTLPQFSRNLVLTVNKGISAASKTAVTKENITKNTLIPDRDSYFKVSGAVASIIRNPQDRPEQILNLEFTVGATETHVNKALEVWVLPEDYPATAVEKEKKQYEWTNPGEVTPAILALATPLNLEPLPVDRNYATLHSFRFKANTPRYIFVKLNKGLTGFGNFSMNEEFRTILKVPELPKEITFLHKGSLLALGGEQKLSVLVRGLDAVKFQYARVLPDNINQLITQTQGDFNDPYFTSWNFNQYNISEIFSTLQRFDASDLSKQQYTALDFSKYISQKDNALNRGLFLLQATAWDTVNNVALNVKSTRLILVTDMAMVVKDNQNGSHDIFVQSITQGTPVINASISILGKNGLPVLTRMTDALGRASFPSLKDFIEEREPVAWVSTFGNDVSFIPYRNYSREVNYSKFDTSGVYVFNDQAGISAYIFSDRGIYRPGDTAHLGFIVKQGFVHPQPAGMPLEIRIMDPRGNAVLTEKVTLDSSGFFTVDFPTKDISPTGQYFVNAYIVKDNLADGLVGSTSFQVNEFLPDRMRIVANLSQDTDEGWLIPDALTATVNLQNLYGSPAADRTISAKILLNPKAIQFKKYPDYQFIDPLMHADKPAKVFTDNLANQKTDDKGQAVFDLQLDRFEKATYSLTFFAEGFEADGGRSVSTQINAMVSPLTWIAGYKPDGDLKYIRQNTERSVHFIGIDSHLNSVNPEGLKMQLIALQPVSTLVKKPDGTFEYQSIVQSKLLKTNPFTLTEKGASFSLPTSDIGDFALALLDKNNQELARVPFTVVGESQKPLPENAELQVKLDKTEYVAGENINLQITAPYTGAGIITIERDKVYAVQWFKTDVTSSIQTIQIPADFEGDGYINVSFVRDWDSSNLFISPLSYTLVPFTVSHKNHQLNIDLEVVSESKPGDSLSIHYKTDAPGKIVLFAVDEGILQVSRFTTPDPLAFFFQKHALQVTTMQTVDLILPKFIQDRELSAVGGDAGEMALAKHLNPFKRKTDLPVVFWSGILDSDTVSREMNYKIPDYFNGKLRIMAVAVSDKHIGSTEKAVEVRGDFIINPNAPTFVTPGDTFEITAGIANNVKGSGELPVQVELNLSSDLELIGEANETISIPEGREKTVHYTLRARTLTDKGKIQLKVSANGKSSSMETYVSVRPATMWSSTIVSGLTKDKKKLLKLDQNVYPEFKKSEIAISANPLILLSGLQHFLVQFPYGCTEQLTSQGWSWLVLTNQPWFGVEPTEIQSKMMEIISQIGQRQMSSGGFSYWPGLRENDDNDFASIYTMHFLTEAREKGYQFSMDYLSQGIEYLKNLVSANPADADEARLQAYAIYVLTRNEIVTTNYLTNLQVYLDKDGKELWKKEITGSFMAATWKLLHNEKEATALISAYQSGVSDDDSSDFYDSNISNAQYLYLLAKHFPEMAAVRGTPIVQSLLKAMNTQEINTVFSGYASLALSAYHIGNQESTSIPSLTEILSDNQEKSLPKPNNTLGSIILDKQATAVRLDNPAGSSWYYQLMQSGFSKVLPSKVIREGMEVSREFRDSNGDTVTSVTLGSEISVHIHIRATDDNYWSNIAIIDLLPGGFEVVRESVKTQYLDYADIREDRVVFFTSVEPQASEIVYKIKAVNTGEYVVPGIVAESMYIPAVKAFGVSGKIVVK